MISCHLNDTLTTKKHGISSGTSLIVCDGFYENPDLVREAALHATYGSEQVGSYPGVNATSKILDPYVIEKFSQLTNSKIIIDDKDAFGVFRCSKLNSPYKAFIHTDPVEWGGVIYLNPQSSSIGGTAFWRHKETGLEEFPWKNWSEYGFTSINDAWSKLVVLDGNFEEKWDLITLIPARYNRLTLFNSKLFHSHMPKENFGNTLNTARLVQIFFFTSKRKN